MNDHLHTHSSAWKIISEARPLMDSLIEALQNETIPDHTVLTRLREQLTDYLSELAQCESIAGKLGNFKFKDRSRDGMSDAEIIGEVSKIPDAFHILHNVAMKKLISANSISQSALQGLLFAHCLAPVDNSLQGGSDLYTLTSKGHYCLTKKKIRTKLCDGSPSNFLPKALRIAPDEWNIFTLFQACIIQRYYSLARIKDYMIIPALDQTNILLGCEISPDPDIRYVFAWIDAATILPGWKACIQETISTQSVSSCIAVCQTKEEMLALQETIKNLVDTDKIQISCIEVSE